MSNNLQKKIFSEFHLNFFDKMINQKRFEMIDIINNFKQRSDLSKKY